MAGFVQSSSKCSFKCYLMQVFVNNFADFQTWFLWGVNIFATLLLHLQ